MGHLLDMSAVDMSCILAVKAQRWNYSTCTALTLKALWQAPRPERTLPEGSPWSRPIKPRYKCFQGGTLYLFDRFAFGDSHWKTFNLLWWCSQADIWFMSFTLFEHPSAKSCFIVPLKPKLGSCWESGEKSCSGYVNVPLLVIMSYTAWGLGSVTFFVVVESSASIKKRCRKLVKKWQWT